MFGHNSYKQFAIVRDVEPRRVTLHVFGDVDMSTVGELNEAIDEIATEGDSLLINLLKCRYFDSSGLAALLQARKVLGARLTILVDPKSQISRVMHLVGFDTLFNVVTELQTTCRDDFVFPSAHDPSFIGSLNVRPTIPSSLAPQH
jgi:anti-anti-sigma factor